MATPSACQAWSRGTTSAKTWAASSPAAKPAAQIWPCKVLSGVALRSASIQECSTATTSAVAAPGASSASAIVVATAAATSASPAWASIHGSSRGRA